MMVRAITCSRIEARVACIEHDYPACEACYDKDDTLKHIVFVVMRCPKCWHQVGFDREGT